MPSSLGKEFNETEKQFFFCLLRMPYNSHSPSQFCQEKEISDERSLESLHLSDNPSRHTFAHTRQPINEYTYAYLRIRKSETKNDYLI